MIAAIQSLPRLHGCSDYPAVFKAKQVAQLMSESRFQIVCARSLVTRELQRRSLHRHRPWIYDNVGFVDGAGCWIVKDTRAASVTAAVEKRFIVRRLRNRDSTAAITCGGRTDRLRFGRDLCELNVSYGGPST